MSNFIGVDPGISGGIAVLEGDKLSLHSMPVGIKAMAATLKHFVHFQSKVYIESVSGYIGVAQPGSRAFVFGENFGIIQGMCEILGADVLMVRPQQWQGALGIGNSRQFPNKSKWKNRLKEEAISRYPGHKVTLKTADALLILDWGLRQGV